MSHRWRVGLGMLLLPGLLLASGCVSRQPGQSDAAYMAQRLDEVLLYTEPLVASVPALVQQWQEAGVLTPAEAHEMRQWHLGALVALTTAQQALGLYRAAQTPEHTQAVAQQLPALLALMSQAVLIVYTGGQ